MTAFISILILAVAIIAGYSILRYGSVRNWRDWVTAVGAAVLIVAILSLIGHAASASERPYLK